MPATVWKGHITFGLVSIPVKLHRAARAERVSFRQLHARTNERVRQTYVARDPEPELDSPPQIRDFPPEPAPRRERFVAPASAARLQTVPVAPPQELPPAPREVSRAELVKGYEYAKDRFVTVTREDLEKITPRTASDMQILEFVQLSEVDPVYFETSYYVSPDRGGERAYALLFRALRESGFVGLAQVAMHNREHIVVIRPGRRGILLHTMFYEPEIRREDEFQADASNVSPKELELALLLVRSLEAPFEPQKYRDTYREKLDALIQAKLEGGDTVESSDPKPAPVIDILEALQRSLRNQAAPKKPAAAEESRTAKKRKTK